MTREQIRAFQEIETATRLANHCYSDMGAVVVDVYLDGSRGLFYQLDTRLDRYRVAKDGQKFGDWVALT